MGLVTASMGLVTDRWGGSLVWWLIGGRGGDWWSDLFVWVSDCRVGWLIGFVVVVGFELAWGGFVGFNLLEMGFSEFEIFLFGLVVLYFWIDLVLWGFRIWWFCWLWGNGDFEIFNLWVCVFRYRFVFLLFLFKTHLDLNSCDFWFLILFLIFFI